MSKNHSVMRYKHPIQWFIASLAIAIVFNLGNSFFSNDSDPYTRSLQVVPNYLYWCILTWSFVSLARDIPFIKIPKAIATGLLIFILYYTVLPSITLQGWLTRPSMNSFSLVLICFTAPALFYIYKRYGTSYSLLALAIVLFILIKDGRRAGFVLTMLSSLGALYLPKINGRYLASGIGVALLGILIFSTETGENTIANLNPRIHALIYESDKITTEDRSYLTRQLMIEKGVILFIENPLWGVGLNNFTNVDVDFLGDFINSEFVINKDNVNETSSHNSYINILAEGGLSMMIPFLTLLLFNVYSFIAHYNIRPSYVNALYWSFTAMIVHLFFITGIVNAFVWFLIALVTAASTLAYTNQPISTTTAT